MFLSTRPAAPGLASGVAYAGGMRRLLLAFAALALLLAGCGGDDGGGGVGGGDGSPKSLVAAAAKKAEDVESYRMDTNLKSDLGGQELTMDGEIVSAGDQSRFHFEGTFGQGGAPKPMEIISVGDDQYIRGEEFESLLPDGKKWLHMTEPATTTMTPPEFLEFLRESPEITEAGRETIRGQETVHLRGPLDMKKLVENTSSQAAKQFAQIPQANELKVTIDVWIAEADDQMARMGLRMTHPDAPGAMEIDGDILEYDVPLDKAEAPPEGEVAEASELTG